VCASFGVTVGTCTGENLLGSLLIARMCCEGRFPAQYFRRSSLPDPARLPRFSQPICKTPKGTVLVILYVGYIIYMAPGTLLATLKTVMKDRVGCSIGVINSPN